MYNIRKLQRPVSTGGLGLPNVLYYYYAASLRHLAHWSLPPQRAPPWFSIKQSVSAPLPKLQRLSTKLLKAHPVISHLQSVWKKVSELIGFDPYLNRASSIWMNPKFNVNNKKKYFSERNG